MFAVRLATMDDAEIIARQTSAVQQLHTDALPDIFKPPSADLFPPTKLATLIQDPNSIVAVAEIDGRVIGHIYGAVVSRAQNAFNHGGSHVYIHQIGVDGDVHRQGVGTALVAFVLDRARAMGISAVHVDHWAFNARAASFFEACGFSPMKIVMRQTLKSDGS
jgi:ribosomal protein S18 acetylase RimI-like enzyme